MKKICLIIFRNKERKSPLSTPSPRSFSTRLPPSSSNKSLSTTERNIATPMLVSNNKRNSRENMTSYTQVQSTPSSPNVAPALIQRQMSTITTNKIDGLTTTYGNNFTKKNSRNRIKRFIDKNRFLIKSQLVLIIVKFFF